VQPPPNQKPPKNLSNRIRICLHFCLAPNLNVEKQFFSAGNFGVGHSPVLQTGDRPIAHETVATGTLPQTMNDRIETMFSRDKLWA